MRIAVIGPPFPDSFADNIGNSLTRMGYETYQVGGSHRGSASRFGRAAIDVASKVPRFQLQVERDLIKRVGNYKPDLTITVEALILPQTVEALRKSGTEVALWFPDHVANLRRMLMFVAPYSAIFFKEPLIVERARSLLGLRVYHLPEACNPAWHVPIGEPRVRPVAIVAGNSYAWRVRLLERILDAGLPVQVFGPPMPQWLKSPSVGAIHTGRYIAREEKARAFRSAALVLNTIHPAEVFGVNCRLFESAGCGAVTLTESRRDLKKYFTPDKEVFTYSSFDELVEKIKWLLEGPAEAGIAADAAHARAHREHTYEIRLASLIETVFS